MTCPGMWKGTLRLSWNGGWLLYKLKLNREIPSHRVGEDNKIRAQQPDPGEEQVPSWSGVTSQGTFSLE
eukprot:12900231-Prorocentrum_lima.AAC.1